MKLIKRRMKSSGGGHLGVIHPNHPILMQSEQEWRCESKQAQDAPAPSMGTGAKTGKRKAPEEESSDGEMEAELAIAACDEHGDEPAKKRRRLGAADDEGEGSTDQAARPQLARGFKPGDSIAL